MEKIEWVVKSPNGKQIPEEADVYLAIYKNGITIMFYKDSYKQITKDKSICVGRGIEKIYFRDGLGYNGYKLCKASGTTGHKISFRTITVDKKYKGYYKLEEDPTQKDVFFIDLSNPIKLIN